MKLMKWTSALGFLLVASQAWCWGAKGHRIIAATGAQLALDGQEFWAANADGLRQLTTVPDRVWKTPATKPGEAPNHWFEADRYVSTSNISDILDFPSAFADASKKYGKEEVVKNGTAPWRIRQFYKMAVDAFRAGDHKSALEYVGVMSHYVGDLSQPLHVSENYDGAMTGNPGIHKFFETDIITNEDEIGLLVKEEAQKLLGNKKFQGHFGGSLMDVILHEVGRALYQKDLVIENDLKHGRDKKGRQIQLKLAIARMADGAATFAFILGHVWQDAGIKLVATPIAISDPAWVSPKFSKITNRSEFIDDDCSLE